MIVLTKEGFIQLIDEYEQMSENPANIGKLVIVLIALKKNNHESIAECLANKQYSKAKEIVSHFYNNELYTLRIE